MFIYCTVRVHCPGSKKADLLVRYAQYCKVQECAYNHEERAAAHRAVRDSVGRLAQLERHAVLPPAVILVRRNHLRLRVQDAVPIGNRIAVIERLRARRRTQTTYAALVQLHAEVPVEHVGDGVVALLQVVPQTQVPEVRAIWELNKSHAKKEWTIRVLVQNTVFTLSLSLSLSLSLLKMKWLAFKEWTLTAAKMWIKLYML